MGSKYTVKVKQLTRLGIRKTETGDYEYIDPSERSRSKYKPIRKYDNK
ncbi:hypothetical protein NBE98_04480 [Clostridium swellfunianum]|nr:hypothetical protein [Clostridium swellfunianum]MCM0647637.1 hypothetical protein [Clostridium swellfunianum]